MKKYIKYIKNNWTATILAPILMLLDVVGGLVQPLLMSKIVDTGIANNDNEYIIKIGVIMILFSLLIMFAGFGCMYFSAKAANGFAANLREDLMSKIQEFSFNNINKFKTSSLIIRLTNDVQVVSQLFQMILRIVIRAPFMFVGGLIMSLVVSKQLSLILVVLIPVLFILIMFLLKMVAPLFEKLQKSIDRVNAIIRENLKGVRVIKSFVREDYEREKFNKASINQRNTSINSFGKIVILFPLINLLMNLTIVIVIWLGSKQLIAGNIEIGSLTSFIMYIIMTLSSLIMMAMVFMNFARAKASSDRIKEVLDEKPDIDDEGNTDKTIEKGEVEYNIKNFIFTDSSGEEVLSNIKFKVNPGDIVAIIGGTGSGKSTLMNLMPRFYDVTEGYVKIDGVDVKDYKLENLRDKIGMVLQENKLFKGTIKSNLKWGNKNATIDEIKYACKVAQIDEFIEQQDKKYDSQVEQLGNNFSGGQKQRLCIARALIKKPKILILDDSVSALDSTTEKNLTTALKQEFKDTTVFIITQRISSCKNADYIFVLENGTIVDKGPHSKLIKTSKIYKEINDSQKEVLEHA